MIYYEDTIVLYECRGRLIDKWKRIEIPESTAHIVNWFSTEVQTIQWKKVFSTNGAGIIGYLYGKKAPWLYLTPQTKNNLIWILNLNIKAKTIKLLEENIAKYLWEILEQGNIPERNKKQ